MRSYKDKNIQKKQLDYNSDRFLYLTSKTFFEYVTILAGKLEIFLIHRNKSDFSTIPIELQKSNINDNGENNEKTKKLKTPGGNI